MIRTSKSYVILAASLGVLLATTALARDRFPLQVTIETEQGDRIEGVAVTVTRGGDAPFRAEGVTSRKGRFETDLPDFSGVYSIHAEKAGLATLDYEVDLAAQGIKRGQTAEVGLKMSPPTAAYYYEKGREALLAHDLDHGLEMMKESVALDAGFIEGWKALSRIYLAASDPAEALAAADTALALDAQDPEVLRNRYDALAELGRTDELDAALDALVAHDPSRETAVLLFNRGVEKMKQEDADGARSRFLKALEIAPDLHQANSALAEVAIGEAEHLEGDARTAKLEEALGDLDGAIGSAPRNFNAWERKVEILKALGRADEAAAVEKKIAELRAGG